MGIVNSNIGVRQDGTGEIVSTFIEIMRTIADPKPTDVIDLNIQFAFYLDINQYDLDRLNNKIKLKGFEGKDVVSFDVDYNYARDGSDLTAYALQCIINKLVADLGWDSELMEIVYNPTHRLSLIEEEIIE